MNNSLYFHEGPSKDRLTAAGMALYKAVMDALRPIVAEYAGRGFNAHEISGIILKAASGLETETILGIVGKEF